MGDVFLIYRCPHCDLPHTHFCCPLDAERLALSVGLDTAAVYAAALGASELGLLVTVGVEGELHALAIRLDHGMLAGTTLRMLEDETGMLNAEQGYAHVAREGRALPGRPCGLDGLRDMLEDAVRGATTMQLSLQHLLDDLKF